MADDTFNQQLFDAMVRHQIGVLRFSAGVRNRIFEILDATESDIRSQIADRLRRNVGPSMTDANLNRTLRLIEKLRETRVEAWNDVNKVMFEELRAYARAEPAFQVQILETIFPVELGLALPDVSRLAAIVNKGSFNGETLQQSLDKLRDADVRRIEQAVRMGMVQGESIPDISRRIVGTVGLNGTDGVTEITRRNAEAITRTMVNGIGAAARREFALANVDVAPQEVFVATLDSRTTPICRSLDGNIYDVGKGPKLPLHYGERSLYAPVVDGEVIGERPIRNFTQQQLVREYADKNGLGKITGADRDNLPLGHKGPFDDFARVRMRELTGVVPAKTTYTQFLRRQSAQFQNDILGPTRGKLFRSGGLELSSFVDKAGNEIPLSELAKFHADAFTAAGLDPAEFR